MKLFTSIPGKLSDRKAQKIIDAFRAWKIVSGAHIYSLNHSEELKTHPLINSEIEFIDCGDQIIFEYSGKPLVAIQNAIKYIYSHSCVGDLVGIINADIIPNALYEWNKFNEYVKPGDLHVFKRLEQLPTFKESNDPFEPYKYGYDLFMFKRSSYFLDLNDINNFCFGVPWWDYWFPLSLKFKYDWRIISHDRPLITHLTHQEQFTQNIWHQKGGFIKDFLEENKLKINVPTPDSISSLNLMDLCDLCCKQIDYDYDIQIFNAIKNQSKLSNGVTVVSACMNRNKNIIECLNSWLKIKEISKIIIVDWSSSVPLSSDLHSNNIIDSRIQVIRVKNKSSWHLSKAFNVGLKKVETSYTLKLDADIKIDEEFFNHNQMIEDIFWAGNWRTAANDLEKRVNGSFLAPTAALKAVNFYNEFIDTYGWDDCDLYERLEKIISRRDFQLKHIFHIEQENASRLKFQKKNLGLAPIVFPDSLNQELEIRRNQIKTRLLPRPNNIFPLNEDSLLLIDLISYRVFLVNALFREWDKGGINFCIMNLAKLSTFTLAALYSTRHDSKFWKLSGENGVDFMDSFISYHPVPSADLNVLKSAISHSVFKPLFKDSNQFAFPVLKIEEKQLSDNKNFRKKILINRPFCSYFPRRIASSKLVGVSENSKVESLSSGCDASIGTVIVKASKHLPGFRKDLSSISNNTSKKIHFFIMLPSSSSVADLEGIWDLYIQNQSNMSALILSWDNGLYDCWNAICMESKSKYIGNWNCDDRRDPHQIDILIDTLDKNPQYLGASTALYVCYDSPKSFLDQRQDCTETWFKGENFAYNYTDMYQVEKWVPNSNRIVSCNYMHCLPLWRKSLHEDGDFFDELKYGPSADWELWMRMSKKLKGDYLLLGDTLGMYYMNLSSYGRNKEADLLEKAINNIYIRESKAHMDMQFRC